ncbi:MAG: tetratricopeptide repeat protein [Polyangiaceae bacterium]
MKRSDCLSELVIRSRRYRLSDEEQWRLQQHLAMCSSCRLEQHVGADFDEICGLRAGDDILVANLADKVVRRRLGLRSGRSRPRAVWMAGAAAGVFFAAAAAAGVLLDHRGATPVLPAATPVAVPPATSQTHNRVRTGIAPSPAPSVEAPAPPEVVPTETRRPRATRVARASAPQVESPPMDTAASLFASANNERRQSHPATAISLYQELQTRYPGTDEARVSRVSLGRLLLERSSWSEGLAQLDAYLSEAPDGMLAPEALFGKARSLGMLGRQDEERSQWAALLAKFPDSVYAAQARRRLEEIR